MKKETKKQLPIKEIIWYIIAGFIAFGGVTMITFGLIGHFMNVPLEQNFIKQAEKEIVLNFTWWGLILLALGALVAIITLLVFAKVYDRDVEKTIRRQQRLESSTLATEMEIKPAVEEVDISSMVKSPVEEKVVEEKKDEAKPE